MSGSTRLLLNYLINKSPLYNTSFIRSISNKDIGIVKNVTNTNDFLLRNLKSAPTPQNVLSLVGEHHKIMNNKHILQALRALFNFQKSKMYDLSTNDIITDPNFKALCDRLKSQARSINLTEAIDALKVMSFVGIPSNSTITQVLLQLIKEHVNDLSLQQIIFLEYIVKRFESTPLSDALLIALPIVFEVNMMVKMDRDNVVQLTDCLQYVSRKHFPDHTVEMLIESIMKHKYISNKDAVRIVWSLCDLTPNEMYVPLLNKAVGIIIKNVDRIQFSDLEFTLLCLSHRTNVHQPYYYNEEFFNLVADITIEKDLGIQQALWISNKLVKVGHSHRGLIDYIAAKCREDENVISTFSSYNVYGLVSACANSEYRPNLNWDRVKSALEQNKNIDTSKEVNWILFATRMAVLDMFIPEIVQKAFSQNSIEKLIQNGTNDLCRCFVTLHQTIWTMQDDLKKYLPSSEDLNKVLNYYNSVNTQDSIQGLPLQKSLEKAFGGKQYIISKCATRRGLPIQHAIIMRKGGFPVAFHNLSVKGPVILEDLVYPADSRIIVILGLHETCYCLNSFELKGVYSLGVRALEASGYSVVVIPIQNWLRFNEVERIPYLMRAIREKTDTLEALNVAG